MSHLLTITARASNCPILGVCVEKEGGGRRGGGGGGGEGINSQTLYVNLLISLKGSTHLQNLVHLLYGITFKIIARTDNVWKWNRHYYNQNENI